MGPRCWWLGKKFGYVTQIQLIRDRYASGALGTVTRGPEGGVPNWLGSLLVCGVTFLYVTYGGMRSTAWANTFQTSVFIVVGAVAYFIIMDLYDGYVHGQITRHDAALRRESDQTGLATHHRLFYNKTLMRSNQKQRAVKQKLSATHNHP